jgi:hypothetical protein
MQNTAYNDDAEGFNNESLPNDDVLESCRFYQGKRLVSQHFLLGSSNSRSANQTSRRSWQPPFSTLGNFQA